MIDGSEKRICRLSFEFQSPHVIERRNKDSRNVPKKFFAKFKSRENKGEQGNLVCNKNTEVKVKREITYVFIFAFHQYSLLMSFDVFFVSASE